jgi:hypothetical protein
MQGIIGLNKEVLFSMESFVGCLVRSFFLSFVDWVVGWLVGCLVVWFVFSFFLSLGGWLVGWLIS